MRPFPWGLAVFSSIRDIKTCRMIRRLLTPALDGLGDLETRSRGSGFAAARSLDDVAAAAGPGSCRLRPARLWPGRADRNRCGGVADADPLLSAAGAARRSLGPICPRGVCPLRRSRTMGAGGDASGIRRGAAGHLFGRSDGADAGHARYL